MIPVDQLIEHDPDNGKFGDCFRAVICSLLGLSPDKVINFSDKFETGKEFWKNVDDFLKPMNLSIIYLNRDPFFKWMEEHSVKNFYHEIAGPSPRVNRTGLWHSVVGLNGEIIHDPHPSRLGLSGNKQDWHYGIFIKLK